MTSSSGPTDLRRLMSEMEVSEYREDAPQSLRDLQDEINRSLAGMGWVTPIGKTFLNMQVTGILRGNRHKFTWEIVTDWNVSPPRIRMIP